jgi:hypothetical protein
VTELCTGGELYDRVVEKTMSDEGHFSEYDAARIMRNILDAIAYCHEEKHIVHRDLKPEKYVIYIYVFRCCLCCLLPSFFSVVETDYTYKCLPYFMFVCSFVPLKTKKFLAAESTRRLPRKDY